jgi:uncharacterized protein (DUF2141 family)
MKRAIITIHLILIILLLSSFNSKKDVAFHLTIEVDGLRNSNGTVLFALYNRVDAFPDEHYKKCIKKLTCKIIEESATVTFESLPEGNYAISILHDENSDGKINRGLLLPKEGIGFSNYESIGFSNRPAFPKASFNLNSDMKLKVKIVYL